MFGKEENKSKTDKTQISVTPTENYARTSVNENPVVKIVNFSGSS